MRGTNFVAEMLSPSDKLSAIIKLPVVRYDAFDLCAIFALDYVRELLIFEHEQARSWRK